MDRGQSNDLTAAEYESMKQTMEEEGVELSEDQMEDQMQLTDEQKEMYGYPEPEEKQNAHSFLHKATFDSSDTVRTTFLSESELGRPLFSVRFMMDMNDISKFYLDPIILELGLDIKKDNAIANYFQEKIYNVTDSGMSNKGFSMNLNVTRKMDATRTKFKPTENLKGGIK